MVVFHCLLSLSLLTYIFFCKIELTGPLGSLCNEYGNVPCLLYPQGSQSPRVAAELGKCGK